MKKIAICCMVLWATALAACKDDRTVVLDQPRPSFSLVESDEESAESTWLSAEYDYSGGGVITQVGFSYKREDQNVYTDVVCADGEWTERNAWYRLEGLQPETTYRYYCYVVVDGVRCNSISNTFTTAPEGTDPSKPEPVFGDPSAHGVTSSGATVQCSYTYRGDQRIDKSGFRYRKSSESAYREIASAEPASPIVCTLAGLEPNTAYTINAYVVVEGRTYRSADAVFTTVGDASQTVPSFGSPVSYGVTATSAGMACTFSYGGDAAKITEAGFRYKTAAASSYTARAVSTAPGEKSITVDGLSSSTAYDFHLYVVVDGKTYRSAEGSFTTQKQSSTQSGAKYAGWAELPAEQVKSGDYYYAYHITDVNNATGRKARNYGVCYSNELKCAVWVAAPMHPFYAAKNVKRTDAYGSDPDIPVSQPGKWTGYTRGHMLGSAERLVSRTANVQVFYHSNIAPQLGQPYFNTGGGAWNTLEDWVDTQWANTSDTTYQVIGSYWANKNKKVGSTTIPTHYYKVLLRTKGHKNKWVVDCSRDELQCIAIMVEHRTYSKNEVPQPSQYQSKGMLHSVKEMEEMTGLTFFPNVPNAPKDTYNASDWGL